MSDVWNVEWHDTLPSTNTYLMEHVKRNPALPSRLVVAARTQTAGRGRQQRAWRATPGRNLTFSFLWNAPVAPDRLPSMAQAIAVGIAHFLAAEGIAPAVKWPNDVQVEGKKIGGILCEIVGTGAIVAGIGLNVNMTAEDAVAIDQPATSLALETRRAWEVTAVLNALLEALVRPLEAWAARGFEGIRQDYARFAPPPGARVSVRDGDSRVHGTLEGFNALGALQMTTDDGEARTCYSGDLTVG